MDKAKKPRGIIRGALHNDRVEEMKRSVLGRPGSDLLFQVLRLSTIGAEDFDGRVRNGIGYRLLAVTTRPAKDGTIRNQ
jgi:class 3 adenylate cyclase